MQKHTRQAFDAIRSVADEYGVAVRHIVRPSAKHPDKAVLVGETSRHVIGLPSSPNDREWAVILARKQAIQACKRLAAKPPSDLES